MAAAAEDNGVRLRRRPVDRASGLDPEEEELKKEEEDARRYKPHFLTMAEELYLLGLKGADGSLSFWNESSFAIRACFVVELELRGRIGVSKDSRRREAPFYLVELVDRAEVGESLEDEALRFIGKCDPPKTISNWLDVLNGDDWGFFKSQYTMSQVRERLAKGLVDKGILRNEAQGFFTTQRSITDKGLDLKMRGAQVVVDTLLGKGEHAVPHGTPNWKRAIALGVSLYQAEFLENLFDLCGVSNAQRALATGRLDEARKQLLLKQDNKKLFVEHPIVNAVLTILVEKD